MPSCGSSLESRHIANRDICGEKLIAHCVATCYITYHTEAKEVAVMAETSKKLSPPYVTFSAFLSFINKLKETGIPNRIDPSLFGNASGTKSYSTIAALKYLRLIDESGAPAEKFVKLVNARDEDRKDIFAEVVKSGYPTLFSSEIDLNTITAGQFDEHIRTTFDVQLSTVDKIAAFFIGAAKYCDINISPHLKARKPVAASSSSKKSSRQRKTVPSENSGGTHTLPPAPLPPSSNKPLEYQLIDLMSEPDIEDEVKSSIWNLVQYLTARKAKKTAADQ